MGTLLDFSAAARRRTPDRRRPAEKGAEIVMFPGVRIERQALDLGARIRKVAKEPGGTARPEA